MEKRPVSLTVIGILLALGVLGSLYSSATVASNPLTAKMLQQSHTPIIFEQIWGGCQAVVGGICAYGILKGLPWSRVLYVVWSAIAIIVTAYTLPMMYAVVSLVVVVVFSVFLWTNSANDWFQARGLMLNREARRG
jgi:hypothetical protein